MVLSISLLVLDAEDMVKHLCLWVNHRIFQCISWTYVCSWTYTCQTFHHCRFLTSQTHFLISGKVVFFTSFQILTTSVHASPPTEFSEKRVWKRWLVIIIYSVFREIAFKNEESITQKFFKVNYTIYVKSYKSTHRIWTRECVLILQTRPRWLRELNLKMVKRYELFNVLCPILFLFFFKSIIFLLLKK